MRGCADLDGAVPGATVRVTGAHLDAVSSVAFSGGTARPKKVRAASLEAVVPPAARSGRVTVISAYGQRATSPRPLTVTPLAGRPAPTAVSRSALLDTRVTGGRVFFYARRRAQLTYLLKTATPQSVRIDLVRLRDERSLVRWTIPDVEPGVTHRLSWNGLARGHVPTRGRYEFRIAVVPASTAAGAGRSTPPTAARAGSFFFEPYIFPVRGPHGYGSSGARFGAGRAGHVHQGQDVLAPCGTPLVAARGGRVKFRAYQGAAGNYLVIDGAGTGVDTAYMHLRAPALVAKGERVYTGQVIGYVGDTGDATACHLHFEMWSPPGWYTGGSAFDPLPSLRVWDRVS